MNSAGGIILCLAYILGLLSTATAWGKFVLLGLGVAAALIVPRFWRSSPRRKLWFAAGIIGLLASLYLQLRMPQPAGNDISKSIPTSDGCVEKQFVIVQGKIGSVPRLTRSHRAQFWLEATYLNQEQPGTNTDVANESQKVSGKLYVTVPLLQGSGLYPGEIVAVTGVLYKPKPATNPGGFDFKTYLAKEGAFAGLSGHKIDVPNQQKQQWGWWALRQKIIRSQVDWLGIPEGALVSAMVLGSRAVDLPYDIKDQFTGVGLAHALGSPGFKLSLILGVLLALTQRFSSKIRFSLGLIILVLFVSLTGMQPATMRAALMGLGVLVALVMQRKIKRRGLLLLAATILLLLNPLWLWDVGFQLSFIATLGLQVTMPPLMKQLDWLPPAIASIIAIPIAVSLWTLPLQLYVFSIVPTYGILANIIASPLITVILAGGIISALAGVILPVAGSALAWLLYYPTHFLIAIAEFFYSLPGNSYTIGKISLLQMLALYGLIVVVWFSRWWHRRWWLAGVIAVALVAIPAWQTKLTLFRATALATTQQQVLVIQDQNQVLLVNSGDADTVNYTVLPFLEQQGVNQIDWAVALDTNFRFKSGWTELLTAKQVKNFYINATAKDTNSEPAQDNQTITGTVAGSKGTFQTLPVAQNVSLGSTVIKLISAEPSVLQLQLHEQSWLVLGAMKPDKQKQVASSLPRAQVLYWSGEALAPELVEALQPVVAIASSTNIDLDTVQQLQKSKTKIYWTGCDGAIQWTPANGFEPTLQAMDNNTSQL